jgi:hypothetical protein
LIFADFSIGYTPQETGVIILVGKHRDFDTTWWNVVGVKIMMAMIGNSITPFLGNLAGPLVASILRYLDRCCKKHLRMVNNIRD